jgi:hypothetical protein
LDYVTRVIYILIGRNGKENQMDALAQRLPEIITAAAQSYLGILALLSVALSLLAYFFFARASEKVKVGIFVLLFLGVIAFGAAMFRASHDSPPAAPATAALSNEAQILLKEAAADPSGLVLFERYGASVDLHTNGVSLLTSKEDHRALALWESALQELVRGGLLIAQGDGGEVFEITKQGYDAAQRIDRTSNQARN